MGYNNSLGIHGIFKKERFTEGAYKALSYLKDKVKTALTDDVKKKTKYTKGGIDRRDQGGEKTIKLKYEGPDYSPPGGGSGAVGSIRPSSVILVYDAKFYNPMKETPSSKPPSNKPSNPRIYFIDEAAHDTYNNGEYIFVDHSNIYDIDDVINNIANKYAKSMTNMEMSINLDDTGKIIIEEMTDEEKKEHEQRLQDEKNAAEQRIQEEKNEAERIEAELEELWAPRAELIENVQKNTRIVTIVRPWTTRAHMTDPIRKKYPHGYVDLKYKGNISRYAISFDYCKPRNTTLCSRFESRIVAKAGTHIYIISKDLFEKLGINDLIFEKGERADNIESLREVLYTLSQRPIPEQSPLIIYVMMGVLFVFVALGLGYLGYLLYNQSKKATLENQGLLPPIELEGSRQIMV